MSDELQISAPSLTGQTLYATMRLPDGTIYALDTAAFEPQDNTRWAHYAIPLTETPSGGGFWEGDAPSGLSTAFPYTVEYRQRAGGSPATGDTTLGSETIGLSGAGADLITLSFFEQFIQDSQTAKQPLRASLITAATLAAQAYAGNSLSAADRVERYDGLGTNYLALGATPVNSIASITFGVDDTTPVVVDGSHFIWNAAGTVVFSPQWPGDSNFDAGFQNIEVAYNAGWVTVPNDLQVAVALIAQALESLASMDPNVTSKSVRDVRVSYGTVLAAAKAGDLSSPVFAGAAALLQRYVLPTCI